MTGLLTTQGRHLFDWSAEYRFFSKERFAADGLFSVLRRGVLERQPAGRPFVAAMDDTIVHKTGMKIKGVATRRDPMSLPFHPNLIRGQRFLHLGGVLPADGPNAPTRMIPIDLAHIPTARKPSRKAGPEAMAEYRRKQRELSLSSYGAERIAALRRSLDEDEPGRPLWMLVDGSYTNGKVLKNLPPNTTLIGRIRGDARLYHPAVQSGGRGRNKVYGEPLPTPEEVRRDEGIPWERVSIFAGGRVHEMRVKTVSNLLWRTSGPKPLRLVVIAPLGYRLRKRSRMLYRNPAYLICTDPSISLQDLVQAYVRRWDIEVNFRDEKQIMGMGEAQVWNEHSVDKVPALMVAAYGFLLLASARAYGTNGIPVSLPLPKWRRDEKQRASTSDLVNEMRYELWHSALEQCNYSGFKSLLSGDKKPEKWEDCPAPALLYARR